MSKFVLMSGVQEVYDKDIAICTMFIHETVHQRQLYGNYLGLNPHLIHNE